MKKIFILIYFICFWITLDWRFQLDFDLKKDGSHILQLDDDHCSGTILVPS